MRINTLDIMIFNNNLSPRECKAKKSDTQVIPDHGEMMKHIHFIIQSFLIKGYKEIQDEVQTIIPKEKP